MVETLPSFRRVTAFRWCTLSSIGVISSLQSLASASENDAFVQLHWQRGPSAQTCPAQTEVEQLVQLRLGRNPFTTSATRIIDASIDRVGSAWHVELHQRDATGPTQGERVFDVPEQSCAQIADAVGLAVALAIDPNASIASLSEPVMPSDVRPTHNTITPELAPRNTQWVYAAPQSTQRYTPLPPPIPTEQPSPYTLQLTLRGLVAGGLLPGAAPGVAVAGSVGGRYVSVTLGASYFPEAWTQFKGTDFAFGLTTIDVGLCGPGLRSEHFTANSCAQVHLGAIHSLVVNAQPVEPGDHFLWSLSIGPRLAWRSFAPFILEAGASAWVTPTQPVFTYSGDQFFQVRTVGIVAFVGAGWASP